MVSGAKFSANDIPFCPTTATEMPALILTYKEALELYRHEMRIYDKNHSLRVEIAYHNEPRLGKGKILHYHISITGKCLKTKESGRVCREKATALITPVQKTSLDYSRQNCCTYRILHQ